MANITFKVITKNLGTALLKFHDYQIGESGHTSVRVMEDNFPVNVLANEPKYFVVPVNQSGNFTDENNTNQSDTGSQDQPNVTPLTLTRPTGFKATTGNGYVFLIWDKSEDSSLKGYNLYYSTTSGRYLQRRPV